MALLRAFERKDRDRVSLHEEIAASYTVFERDGRMLLQIDTYGRDTRQEPGKQSQTIQLAREGARRSTGFPSASSISIRSPWASAEDLAAPAKLKPCDSKRPLQRSQPFRFGRATSIARELACSISSRVRSKTF